jgi:hypothetical protein
MGHTRVGRLPATRWWNDVVGLIADGADAARIAEAVTKAWERAFNHVRDDAGFREAVYILSQIGVAGKSRDVEKLDAAGVSVKSAESVFDVALAVNEAMYRRIEGARQRSDFGELAQRALVGAVTDHLKKEVSGNLPGVAPGTTGIRQAVAKCGKEKEFGELSKTFFARLTNECLGYFLSKTLPEQVGENRRFANTEQLGKFESAMRTHCSEAAEIVRGFSGEWFSKNYYEGKGTITRDTAEKFGWFGLEKMRRELGERARADAK